MKIIVDTSISYYSIEKLIWTIVYCWNWRLYVCWKEATLSFYKVQLKFSKDFTMLSIKKPIVRKIGVAVAINRIEFDYIRLRR